MTSATAQRLQSGSDIVAVLQGRRQHGGRLIVVHVRAREDEAPARLAVVASRRVGGAVARNRAKRLMREAARQVDWRVGVDVVIVARRACADSQLMPVHEELVRLVDNLELVAAGS